MKLNKTAFGLSAGIIWGLAIFLSTVFLLIKGSDGNTISKLAAIYYRYTFSYLGSIIGLIWGFVTGFIGGWLFALVYNLFANTD
jgi:hypothetical protein